MPALVKFQRAVECAAFAGLFALGWLLNWAKRFFPLILSTSTYIVCQKLTGRRKKMEPAQDSWLCFTLIRIRTQIYP